MTKVSEISLALAMSLLSALVMVGPSQASMDPPPCKLVTEAEATKFLIVEALFVRTKPGVVALGKAKIDLRSAHVFCLQTRGPMGSDMFVGADEHKGLDVTVFHFANDLSARKFAAGLRKEYATSSAFFSFTQVLAIGPRVIAVNSIGQ